MMRLWFYRLNLLPIAQGLFRQTTREGFILEWQDARGRSHYGEAAPLPGVHEETLAEVADTLRAAASVLNHGMPDRAKFNWTRPLFNLLVGGEDVLPSARFAVESIFSSYALHEFFAESATPVTFPVADLWVGDEAEEDVVPLGPVVKLKIGGRSWADEAVRIKAIHQKFPNVTLRLDGNRSFTRETALRLWDEVRTLPIQYWEEPGQLPETSLQLRPEGIPIAWDETLWNLSPDQYPEGEAYVIKPSRHLGISGTLAAGATGKPLSLSSCFESGVSLPVYALLAQRIGAKEALGLGTYRFLREDVTVPSTRVTGGQVHWDFTPRPILLNPDTVQLVWSI